MDTAEVPVNLECASKPLSSQELRGLIMCAISQEWQYQYRLMLMANSSLVPVDAEKRLRRWEGEEEEAVIDRASPAAARWAGTSIPNQTKNKN